VMASSSNVFQSHHSAARSKAIDTAKYLFQICHIVVVEESTSSICNKVCQLKHASMARIGEIRNINDVAKIPTACSVAFKVGHELANCGFTPRVIHYHYALVCVTSFVLPYEKGVETLTNVLKAIAQCLGGGLDGRHVDSRDECYETWKTSIGDYIVQRIKKSCLSILTHTPKARLSSAYVGCMKLYWDLNGWEKLPLNFVQLF